MLALKELCLHPETKQPYIVHAVGGRDNSEEGHQVVTSHSNSHPLDVFFSLFSFLFSTLQEILLPRSWLYGDEERVQCHGDEFNFDEADRGALVNLADNITGRLLAWLRFAL